MDRAVSTKFYLSTLTFEFYIIFMGHEVVFKTFLFSMFKTADPFLAG